MFTLLGYLAAILMGLSLGLIGGGGAIFTVPVMVYLFHFGAESAIAHSLFVVGAVSLAGAAEHFRARNIDIKAGLLLGIPSLVVVALTRRLVVPLLPQVFFQSAGFTITKDHVLMLLFAGIMLAASYNMLFRSSAPAPAKNPFVLMGRGAVVGFITGLLGTGGGFLLVPALVFLAGLDMKKAIGTSLALIAANSFVGFFAGMKSIHDYRWPFLLTFTAIAIIGIFAGAQLSKKISGEKLKQAFGYVVLGMALFILVKEGLSMM